jgi:hypothetical protein
VYDFNVPDLVLTGYGVLFRGALFGLVVERHVKPLVSGRGNISHGPSSSGAGGAPPELLFSLSEPGVLDHDTPETVHPFNAVGNGLVSHVMFSVRYQPSLSAKRTYEVHDTNPTRGITDRVRCPGINGRANCRADS